MVLALSQSIDPQRHLTALSFADEPSVILHKGYLLHMLSAAVQTMPVPFPSALLVQAVFPQMQGALSSALLGADPSVIWQANAVSVHMHDVTRTCQVGADVSCKH